MMEIYPNSLTIFLEPPSLAVCEQRLRSRGTDSEATIVKRLRRVHEELQLADRYRHRVVNDELDHAVGTICQILSDQLRT